MLIITLAYQYTIFLLWRTSHLYDTFLGGLRQYQYADYYFGVPVPWCLP